jgi:CRP/FNR family cyclic AMP-dependent transcriptional regulator
MNLERRFRYGEVERFDSDLLGAANLGHRCAEGGMSKMRQTFAFLGCDSELVCPSALSRGQQRILMKSPKQSPRERKEAAVVTTQEHPAFDPERFLASAGLGRRIIQLKAKETFFSQGNQADSIFYLQKGRAKLTVVSAAGKEATITLLTAGEFVGEESIAGAMGHRLATATAIIPCTALKIEREEMIRVMHEEHAFSDLFLKFLLARGMRTQADLVDQLFNSSEKRLARILLLMAEFGKPCEPESLIPKITQETLAEMIGTTRSRVSFFMNRFRRLGFISYNGRIQVHKSLLNVVLHDQLTEQNAASPRLAQTRPQKARGTTRRPAAALKSILEAN